MHSQRHSISVKTDKNILQPDKGNLCITHAKIKFNDERLKAFSLWSGIRQGCPLSLLFSIVLEVIVRQFKEEK